MTTKRYPNTELLNKNSVNLDISNKCTLKCGGCERNESHFPELKKVTSDLSFDDFVKIADFYKSISFCGQISDPVYNKDFDKMLSYAYKNENFVSVHHAAPHKKDDWYDKLFKSNPTATWVFGIDGLVDTSPKYRVNQDTKRLFEIMKKAKKILTNVEWQYIIFNHNQHQIKQATLLAKILDVSLSFLLSNRFDEGDYLMPSEGFYTKRTNKNVREGTLDPKCLKSQKSIGMSAMGYLVPCCWMGSGDVEKLYPQLCNENTKISNVTNIKELYESEEFNNFVDVLINDPSSAPDICWKKCSTNSTKPPQRIYMKELI